MEKDKVIREVYEVLESRRDNPIDSYTSNIMKDSDKKAEDKILEKITGKDIDGWIYNWVTVAVTLIVYGVLFIVVEKWQKNKPIRVDSVDDISYSQALVVGCFQTLSIIPGTSRSGSTILGARTIGISRSAAAEFSFFMGIPAMVGASLIKGYGFFDYVSESGVSIPALAWIVLAVASVVAFAVSMVAIKFLMECVPYIGREKELLEISSLFSGSDYLWNKFAARIMKKDLSVEERMNGDTTIDLLNKIRSKEEQAINGLMEVFAA